MSTVMLVTFCLNICLFSKAFPLCTWHIHQLTTFPTSLPLKYAEILENYQHFWWFLLHLIEITIFLNCLNASLICLNVCSYWFSFTSAIVINAHLFYRSLTALSCVITNTFKTISLCLLTLYKWNFSVIYNDTHTVVIAWDASIIKLAKQQYHCSSCNITPAIITTIWSKKFGILEKN